MEMWTTLRRLRLAHISTATTMAWAPHHRQPEGFPKWYYADFVHHRNERLQGREQRIALEEIGAEIDNVRHGWSRAVRRADEEHIGKFLNALYCFYNIRGWFQEGENLFEQAAAKLKASPDSKGEILGRVLARQGRFAFHLGHYERARELYQTSLSISRRLHDRENVAFSLLNLGLVSHVLGEHAEAKRFNQGSLAIYQDLGDPSGVAFCLNNLGNGARSVGELVEAKQLYQECLAIRRQIGDAHGVAIALNNLGNVAEALGEYAEAQRLYQECLANCREIDYPSGIAASLTNLGYVAWKLGQCAEAKQLHQESLAIKRELGDRRSIALSLINLGEATCTLGEYRESKNHFDQALKMATGLHLTPLVVEALTGIAALLSAIGEKKKALELCASILGHPASGKEPRSRAERLLSELTPQRPAEAIAGIQARTLQEWTENMWKEIDFSPDPPR
jgi:tetratricopeptide (TPR) repeat protein